VLKDYDVVIGASDFSGVDVTSEKSLEDYRAKSDAANEVFRGKYPNIKCAYNDGQRKVSICVSTHSDVKCSSAD
jgi:hypothetical protein